MGGPAIVTRRCRRCGGRKPLDQFDAMTTCRGCATSCVVCGGGRRRDCDIHVVPPVCVCDHPNPEPSGECRNTGCHRVHRPHVGRLAEVRDAWRQQLELVGLVPPDRAAEPEAAA